MATYTTPRVTALQTQAVASLFLNDHLPDRFAADQPQLGPDDHLWHVPVILVYPGIGVLGHVGEIVISATVEKVISSTPLAEMKQAAQELYTAHRDAIDTAFAETGNPVFVCSGVFYGWYVVASV
jgi:hypothetical protein